MLGTLAALARARRAALTVAVLVERAEVDDAAEIYFVGGGVVRHRATVDTADWEGPAREGLEMLSRSPSGALAADALEQAAIVEERLRHLRTTGAALELAAAWDAPGVLERVGRAVDASPPPPRPSPIRSSPTAEIRAAAALALSGRFGPMGRQSAEGLRAWASRSGVSLRIEDDRSDPGLSARLASSLAPSADLLFGPYGSGPGRAVADEMADRPEVVWNHGAAATSRTGARMVDVLGPAESYWRGLPAVLSDGGGEVRLALVRAPGGFGRAVHDGALQALDAAGIVPVATGDLEGEDAAVVVARAKAAGAAWVVGGGRIEDDLALAAEVAGAGLRAALVVCGVRSVLDAVGRDVIGWLGPVQWDGDESRLPRPLPAGSDYPAAQALAAGIVAERALELAGSSEPAALWDAARALRTTTFLGPFAIDDEGRQTAHAPAIVRWEAGPEGPRRRVVWRPSATA